MAKEPNLFWIRQSNTYPLIVISNCRTFCLVDIVRCLGVIGESDNPATFSDEMHPLEALYLPIAFLEHDVTFKHLLYITCIDGLSDLRRQ